MANVKQYSLSRDGNKNLTKNFKVREFRCKDGADKILICQETVNILQAIRDYFGQPITINSAYRTPTHNKKVGGASSSQHVKGTACDIVVKNVPPKAVAAYLEANYKNHGIGLYNTFVHIDSRGRKTYWKNSGSNVVTSFKLGNIYINYKYNDKGKGEEVTQEQFNQMLDSYLSERAKLPPSEWSQEARRWAENNSIVQGDTTGQKRYKSYITREETVTMLYNLVHNTNGK